MNKIWLLFLLVIPYPSIHAQKVQHAPTVEQCRADQKLWFSKEAQFNSEGIANLNFNELTAWGREMSDCLNVDPRFASEYYNTLRDVRTYQLTRLTAFIDPAQSLSREDAQGKGR